MKKRKVALALVLIMAFSLAIPAFAAETKVNLAETHAISSDSVEMITDPITDSYGKTYGGKNLRFDCRLGAYEILDLNGAYESLDATIVCSDGTGSDAVMNVGIFADGKLIYSLTNYTRQKPAETIQLNVSGVGQLAIKTNGNGGDEYLFFVDSKLTKKEKAGIYPNRANLLDLVVIDADSVRSDVSLFSDTYGDVHSGWIELFSNVDPYVLYNLDKKYESLSGCIVPGPRTGQDASMNVSFYLDDELVLSKEGITRETPQIDFELDVANKGVLKIVAERNDGYDAYLYVCDTVLKAHDHKPGNWETKQEATCTDSGQKVKICTECKEIVETEVIPAAGHKPDGKWETEKEATCSEEGSEVQHCSVCKVVCDTRAIEKKPHTPSSEWEVTIETSCFEEGLQEKKCTTCGEIIEQEPIEMVDHTYGDWETVSGSIWNNPIVKERACEICGNTERSESNSTSWFKPLVIILLVILFGGLAVICITLKMNGLALEPASVKKLFSKEAISDTDIDSILNKKNDHHDEPK